MTDNIYNVAVYVRLSSEEKRDRKDSEAIGNQRDMLLAYIKDKPDMKLYDIYCDNGRTGTDFDREEFHRMMYDIYNGKVNCVAVKDLSRFGREYIETGDYLERIFPMLGIRFIAVNDNYDNKVQPFDISVPIKNILNSLYAKDLSRKSSAALRIKQANGEFIGTYASYGYLKSPENNHKIIIDEETAPIVKMIFEWKADGLGYASICRRLYEMNIMPPGRYRYDKEIVTDERYKDNVFWKNATIKRMLSNQVYIGNLTQGRKKSYFYDGGKKENILDETEWVIVEGTHEPIISEELFYRVQDMLEERTRQYFDNLGKYDRISDDKNIFRHKIICGDCGTKLTRYKDAKKGYKKAHYTYICPQHASFPKNCQFFSVTENTLKDIVMNCIRKQMTVLLDFEKTAERMRKGPEMKRKKIRLSREISNTILSVSALKQSRIKLVSDYAKGILCDDEFIIAKTDFERQLNEETKQLEELKEEQNRLEKLLSSDKWITDLKRFKGARKLTQELVDSFIESITVYPDKNITIKWTYQDKLKGGDLLEG